MSREASTECAVRVEEATIESGEKAPVVLFDGQTFEGLSELSELRVALEGA